MIDEVSRLETRSSPADDIVVKAEQKEGYRLLRQRVDDELAMMSDSVHPPGKFERRRLPVGGLRGVAPIGQGPGHVAYNYGG